MNADLLMELADCRFPEQLHGVIFKHHPHWQPPESIDDPARIPVEDFATSVNIIELRELDAKGFEGALLTDAAKTKGIILYKNGVRYERRRFTIGHELGHFLIPSHQGNRQCTAADLRENRRDNLHRRQEAEANRFAAGLLMPRDWFSRDLERLGDADVTHVQRLAKRYGTSLEATGNRYTDLSPDACAFVFSKDEEIRYLRPTTNFPTFAVKRGERLPSGCASLRAPALPLRVATSWSEIDGSVWLRTKWGERTPKVFEQSMRQSDGFQVSLLFVDTAEIEAEDEDEEVNRSWQVRFHKR